MILKPAIHAAIMAKVHGAQGLAPQAPAQAGFPMHPAAQLEMAKQGVKDHLKRVRHHELHHEMHQVHKARSGEIEKEQEDLFGK